MPALSWSSLGGDSQPVKRDPRLDGYALLVGVDSHGARYRRAVHLVKADGVAGVVVGVVCGRGRNPTLRLWPTIFSGKIDVFPGDRRSRLISSMTSVAPA